MHRRMPYAIAGCHLDCRVNYALIVLLAAVCSLLRRPHALLAIMDCTLAVLCLNDTFATSLR